jgi:hypothetical protein
MDRDCAPIAKCTYWDRLWVLQEILLAREVGILLVDKIHVLFRQGFEDEFRPTFQWGTHLGWLGTFYYGGDKDGFLPLSLLSNLSSTLKCSDSRDVVYGIMGLVFRRQWIEVNYNLSKEQVFYACLDMLCRTEAEFWKPWFMSIDGQALRRAKVLSEAVLRAPVTDGAIERYIRRATRYRFRLRAKATIERLGFGD